MRKLFIVLALFIFNSLSSFGQEINIGIRDSLFSKTLSESRPLSVYFPPSYFANENQKFPVLYILDGDYNFQYVTGLIELQSSISENIPEMIVVGISGKGSTTYRNNCKPNIKDLKDSGNADKTALFLKNELVPFINSKYKAGDYKILAGHSIGGLFVINTALNNPDFFDNYIAISPALWWENNAINNVAKKVLSTNSNFRTTVYVSLANEKGMGVSSFLGTATSSLLKNNIAIYGIGILFLLLSIFSFLKYRKQGTRFKKIVFPLFLLVFGIALSLYLMFVYYPTDSNFKFRKFANENHNSVGTPTYKWALNDIFKKWKVEKQYFESTNELNQHYDKAVATYDKAFNMPNGTLANTVLYILKGNTKELYQMQEKLKIYYPNSIAYFNTLLATNSIEKKDFENAEKLLTQTLKSQPNSFEVYQKLSELKKEQNKLAEADSLIVKSIELAKQQNARQWQLNELLEAKEFLNKK